MVDVKEPRTEDETGPLRLLSGLIGALATTLEVEETIRLALTHVMACLEAEAASLFLVEGEALVCRACSGPIDITGVRLPLEQGIIGRTARDGVLLLVTDTAQHPDFTDQVDAATGFVTRSLLCAPLQAGKHCLGVLELLNKKGERRFDARDGSILSALASAAALAIHNARLAREQLQKERMEAELTMARAIQESFFPRAGALHLPIFGGNIPARLVSGDFYDYFELADGRLFFTLGDVSGKGVRAALLMAKTASLVRAFAREIPEPGPLLARVNRELLGSAAIGMFVTLIAGVLEPESGRILLANAGHHPALLHDRGGAFTEIRGESPPLGILPDLDFPAREVWLGGGSLYLFSDGLVEDPDHLAEGCSQERLRDWLTMFRTLPPAGRVETILQAARPEGGPLHDDLTLLLVER